jgi:hypothetical protein
MCDEETQMTRILGVAACFTLLVACPPVKPDCDDSADSAACDTGEACDTVDTSTDCSDDTDDSGVEQYTGDMSLGVDSSNPSYPTNEAGEAHAAVNYWCDLDVGNNGTWMFLFYTIGWSSGGELSIFQTGVAPENAYQEDWHDVPASSQGFDEDGWWDSLYLSLPITTVFNDVVLNNTTTGDVGVTLFECSQARLDTLSFLLKVNDSANTSSVCTTWGEDPSFFGTGGDFVALHSGTACNDVWQ